MKKQLKAMLLACLLVLSLTVTAFAEEAALQYHGYTDETVKSEFIDSVWSSLSVCKTKDEVQSYIDAYQEMGYDKMVEGLTQFQNVVESLGEVTSEGDFNVSVDEDDVLTATQVYEFDNGTAYEFGLEITPDYIQDNFDLTSMTFTDVSDKSIGSILKNAGLNTLMGMGTVFVVLIIIIIAISLLRYVPGLLNKNSGHEEKDGAPSVEAGAVPAPAKAAPVPVKAADAPMDDTQLVAVIAAAVAASMGATSTDGFVVRSIRKRR